jgi:hypothetical protein
MGRTACMDMVLELRMETSSLTVEGAVKPSASACSTAVQVRDQERDLEKRRRQSFEQEATALQGGVSCELRGVQAFRHVRDDNFAYDVNRQVPIFESRS